LSIFVDLSLMIRDNDSGSYMITRSQLSALSVLVLFSGQVAPGQTVQQHIEAVTGCLKPQVVIKDDSRPCPTLSERMSQMHVPGVSVAVIHNGAIEWARGFGVKQLGGAAVGANTIFQAGSISKPLAAMAALHLVQEGKLALDAPVNSTLVSWKLPESPAAKGKPVTLRELLTHTGGLTVHGFPGYAAKEPVPTLVQVLDGQKPANTPPIRLESEPGAKWNYSGGGYTVMQQMVLDVSKKAFPTLLHDTVLGPMGMTHSTYQQPLPAELRPEAAVPYQADGTAVAGGAHTYPEMAAAGLWTTPSDLARYCLEVQRSLVGKANHVVSQDLTRQMLTPGIGKWGLGLQIGGSAGDPYFSHGGVNEGFESLFVAYEHHGDGAVVMTNAQGGSALAEELMQSIAAEYGWPDFHPKVRTAVKVDAAVLARYVGTYKIAPDFEIVIKLDGKQLITQASGQPAFPLFAESQTKFFLTVVDAQVEFFTDAKGQISHMMLYQGGQEIKGVKK
jgi:CubicO group peptidase (beta-lactamase class C family)